MLMASSLPLDRSNSPYLFFVLVDLTAPHNDN